MKPMEGIRVVEVAAWMFVPAAGAVLAEWGAEVLKIEHPDGGDPQRGLVSSGLVPDAAGGVNYFIESRTMARSRWRNQPSAPGRTRRPLQAVRDGRRVPHQLVAGCPPAGAPRRRGHSRRQPEHRLRARPWSRREGPRRRQGPYRLVVVLRSCRGDERVEVRRRSVRPDAARSVRRPPERSDDRWIDCRRSGGRRTAAGCVGPYGSSPYFNAFITPARAKNDDEVSYVPLSASGPFTP